MSNGADIVAALFLITVGLLGYYTGAIMSILYVVGGFAGVFIAQKCAALSPQISFFWWYLTVVLVLIAMGMMVRWLARVLLLGFADRAAGFCIGMTIGVLLLCLALEPVTAAASAAVKKQIRSSYVATHLVPAVYKRVPRLAAFSFDRLRSSVAKPTRN